MAINWDIAGYFWGISDGPEGVFAATYNSAPIALVLKIVGFVIPIWVVEKFWLILVLWLAGVGASRLPYLQGIGRYYAGIFYMVNPFTYVRFVAGQWGILGSYALIPFAVTSFIRLLETRHPRHAVLTALLLTLVGFLQVHGLVLAVLLLLILYVHRVVSGSATLRDSLRPVLLTAALFLGLNSFWIVRYALAGGGVIDSMQSGELSYFAASPAADVLSLRGFWLAGPYRDISDLVPVWWLLFGPILFIAVYGLLRMAGRSDLRWLGLGIATAAIVSFVLAAGPGVSGLFQPLWDHVPPYRVFRDSHKFVALLAFAFAYLGAFGVQSMTRDAVWRQFSTMWVGRLTAGLVLIVPVVFGLPIIFGAWGQLRTSDFPPDWYEVRTILDADREDFNVLVLPWHMYLDFPWLNNRWKRLANPAPNFFSQPTISGDNIEAGPTASNSSNPVSKYVESLLRHRGSVQDFGALVAPMNTRYVILFKAADYESYDFLRHQVDLEVVFEGENIVLFSNLRPTFRGYMVDAVEMVRSLDEYVSESADRDPMGRLYVLGSGGEERALDGPPKAGPSATSSVVRASALSYRVGGADGEYLVFTLPQRVATGGWEYEGLSGVLNLGMMPSFQVRSGDGTISFVRFYRWYLPTYAVALVSLAIAAVVYRRMV